MPNTINKKVSCFRKLCNLAAMEGYNKNAVSLRVWKDRTIKEIAQTRNGSPLWERNSHGEIVRPKYELVTSHTARRSGATNLYKLGVLSDQEIRSITGHQSQKVFESYIRIGISEQAQRVGDKILTARKAKETLVDK